MDKEEFRKMYNSVQSLFGFYAIYGRNKNMILFRKHGWETVYQNIHKTKHYLFGEESQ